MGWNNFMGRVDGLMGSPQIPQGGVLGEPRINPQQDARLALATNLLAGTHSGQGFNAILSKALMAGQQARQQAQAMQAQQREQKSQEELRAAQIKNLNQPQQANAPASVQEYEYAKQNGFKGSFEDWTTMGGQTSRPSSVQEWEFFSTLPLEVQKKYLELKRNPNMSVQQVAGVPTIVAPSNFGTTTQQLSSLPAEVGAAKDIAAGKSAGGVVGEAQGAIEKKGINSGGVLSKLDLAEPLIDAATGSLAGAARDKLAAAFGEAPKGAQAIAQLKVLQADLMLSMPRMEGPQSDRDTMLYREAAGQLGDEKVPAAIKKAAVSTIRKIQENYGGVSSKPKTVRKYNPATGKIE